LRRIGLLIGDPLRYPRYRDRALIFRKRFFQYDIQITAQMDAADLKFDQNVLRLAPLLGDQDDFDLE
jgi:hypothetical protein